MQNIQQQILKFNQDRDWDQFHSPGNLAKSIAIEAGELLECFQWNNEYDIDEVKFELADVLNYCLLLADKIKVDPAEIIREKLKISAEKYPVDKCRGHSDKYTKLGEK